MGSRKNTPANRFRPGITTLEDRTAPAAHTWITNGVGLWNDPLNWAGGSVPQADTDQVTVTFAQPATVVVNVVDQGLVVNDLNFASGGTNLVLNTGLSVGIEDFVQTFTANTAGNQINGPAALTLVGAGQDVFVGPGDTLVINAPLAGAGGFNKTGAGLLQLGGTSTLAGTIIAVEGTTALATGANLGTLRVGDGNVNNGSPLLVVNANATPSVDVLLVNADGTVTIGNGAVFAADAVTLGTAAGGGTVDGAGTLRVGLAGLTVAASGSASEIASRLSFSSPFSPSVTVPDVTAGVDLIVSGVVGGINGFTKAGDGTMRLSSLQANTLSDTITVANGTLEIGGAAGVAAVADALVVQGGLNQPAAVRQLFSNVIANDASVTVGFLGTYNQNNLVEVIQALTVTSDGVYTVGNGVLGVSNGLTLTNGDIQLGATGILIPPANIFVNPDGNFTTNAITGGSIDLTGGRTFNVALPAVLTITSALTDGSLTKVGTGEVLLAGVAAQAAAAAVTAGTLTIGGSRPNTTVSVSADGFLRGAAGTGAIAMTGGSFQPGDSQGNGFFAPSLAASGGAELVYAVFAPDASNELTVAGAVSLAGSTLTFISLADVPLGTTFTFINKTGAGAVAGTFAGVPEGGTVIDAGAAYRISYVGGDGNDVTATRVTPTTTTLVPSAATSPVGTPVSVVATVAADGGVPTGTVRFFVDDQLVGLAQLNAQGQATTQLPFLAVGTPAVRAEYAGTATFGSSSTDKVSLTVTSAAASLAARFAAGAGDGGRVRMFNPDGSERASLTPFAGFAGSVRTAVADFTGDGVADLAVGAGPGATPRVLVIDGQTNAVILDTLAFEAAFGGGVYLAAGDLTGDGRADLVITPDEGGGPRVLVLRGGDFQQVANFFGIDDANFRGGARAAVGDINRDGRADLIVSAGFGGGPRVAGFDGRTVTEGAAPAKLFADFFLFEPALRNGAFAAVGDVNGDGFGDLIGGGGPGGGPRVLALSGADLTGGAPPAVLANFFAGNADNRGGVRVAARNLDGDAFADLVVGDGAGAGSRVTGYLGAALTAGSTAAAFGFDAFAGSTGGVFVG